MAAIQRRKGPNVVGIYGILQPFSDGLKLVIKEINTPFTSNRYIFIFAPFIAFFISLIN